MLTLLWPFSTHRQYVIWSVCCNPPCWHSCGLVPLSVCMWLGLFAAILSTDSLVALFHPQPVCDQVCLLQFPCWPSCGLVSPSVCMWSGLFAAIPPADPLVALFHPQAVCDLVCLLQFPLLTLLWPCSTLREYVIWSVCCNSPCWPSCGLVPPSGCMWSGLFAAIPPADPLVALFHPQWVCDLVCLLQFPLLTLLWPCSTWSLYVIWSVCCNSHCWPYCGLVPSSGCMWSGLFAAIPSVDQLMVFFHPQHVCDLFCLLQLPLLTFLWLCPILRQYVIYLICCKAPYSLFLFFFFRLLVIITHSINFNNIYFVHF